MIIGAKKKLSLQTRKGRDITNECNIEESSFFQKNTSNMYRERFSDAIHRPTNPCSTYNCHGLTFASRRTQIWKDNDLEKILEDDGYIEVKIENVSPGDIVIYKAKDNTFIHSGIVLSKDKKEEAILLEPRPIILSKWGECHEVIHKDNYCPYVDGTDITYHRIIR